MWNKHFRGSLVSWRTSISAWASSAHRFTWLRNIWWTESFNTKNKFKIWDSCNLVPRIQRQSNLERQPQEVPSYLKRRPQVYKEHSEPISSKSFPMKSVITTLLLFLAAAVSVNAETGVGSTCYADGLKGICQTTSTYCEGWYEAGHCPGPKNVLSSTISSW